MDRLFELITYVNNQSSMRITTGMLNNVLADATARVQPPTDKGRRLKIYYMTQIGIKRPTSCASATTRGCSISLISVTWKIRSGPPLAWRVPPFV